MRLEHPIQTIIFSQFGYFGHHSDKQIEDCIHVIVAFTSEMILFKSSDYKISGGATSH